MAVAFADSYEIIPDPSSIDEITGFFGLPATPPAVAGSIQGQQVFEVFDTTTDKTVGTFDADESTQPSLYGAANELLLVTKDLSGTAGTAAGATALAQSAEAARQAPAQETLPTVRLGPHQVSRLIIGGNPIYGHSHFNRLFSRHMTDWHTPERVLELLRRCEQVGINTWQNSYAERTLADLDRYRKAGGRMHWLCLGKPDWDQHPDHIDDAAKHKPIGIAPHGALGDRLFREKKFTVLTDLLKRIRDQGVLVGLSAHNPALIEAAEDKGWAVDYYMCSLYHRTRTHDELKQLLLADKDQLARALAAQLLTYGTGAPPGPAERAEIEAIVGRLRAKDYGFQSLVHEIVQSRAFRNK